MSQLGATNNVHMQSETAVQNPKTTACAKHDYVSEDKTPTGKEVRLHNSMISAQRSECAHRVNTLTRVVGTRILMYDAPSG